LVAVRAVHMGAKEFLVKPVLPTRLLLALQQVLR
jgi:FixJ family two-component response regulator